MTAIDHKSARDLSDALLAACAPHGEKSCERAVAEIKRRADRRT